MKESLRILHINDLHSHFEAYPKIKRFFEKQSITLIQVPTIATRSNFDRPPLMFDE